jgi:hypothetical protein
MANAIARIFAVIDGKPKQARRPISPRSKRRARDGVRPQAINASLNR